jgi:hypothetical protein
MRLARDPVDVRLAMLLVYLARLGDDVEDDGSLGLPVSLSKADLALWVGAKPRSVGTAPRDWRSRRPSGREAGHPGPGILDRQSRHPRDRRAAA